VAPDIPCPTELPKGRLAYSAAVEYRSRRCGPPPVRKLAEAVKTAPHRRGACFETRPEPVLGPRPRVRALRGPRVNSARTRGALLSMREAFDGVRGIPHPEVPPPGRPARRAGRPGGGLALRDAAAGGGCLRRRKALIQPLGNWITASDAGDTMVHMSGGARIHCLVAVQCELLHTNPISLRCNIVWKVWLKLQEDLVI
jgi:hypothetical protein